MTKMLTSGVLFSFGDAITQLGNFHHYHQSLIKDLK